MANVTIPLNGEVETYAEMGRSEKGFASLADYINDLILKDQEQREREKLEKLLLEGLESGEAAPWTAADFDRMRETIREKARQRGLACD